MTNQWEFLLIKTMERTEKSEELKWKYWFIRHYLDSQSENLISVRIERLKKRVSVQIKRRNTKREEIDRWERTFLHRFLIDSLCRLNSCQMPVNISLLNGHRQRVCRLNRILESMFCCRTSPNSVNYFQLTSFIVAISCHQKLIFDGKWRLLKIIRELAADNISFCFRFDALPFFDRLFSVANVLAGAIERLLKLSELNVIISRFV